MAVNFSEYDPILFILFRLIKIKKMLQLYILSIYVHATIRKGHKMRGVANFRIVKVQTTPSQGGSVTR